MGGRYGENWMWQGQSKEGFLARNRWYCIEQRVKLNSLEWDDGIFQVWIDGRLAFNRRDVRYRYSDKLKIDRIWMNVFHGGTALSPSNQHVFFDNVVVARSYIGPIVE